MLHLKLFGDIQQYLFVMSIPPDSLGFSIIVIMVIWGLLRLPLRFASTLKKIPSPNKNPPAPNNKCPSIISYIMEVANVGCAPKLKSVKGSLVSVINQKGGSRRHSDTSRN